MKKIVIFLIFSLLFSAFVSAAVWNSTYENGLTNYYKFDENSSTTAIDYKNAQNGTIEGTPAVVNGKLGLAYNFTGNTKRVKFIDSGSTMQGTGGNTMTIAAWVYPYSYSTYPTILSSRTVGGQGYMFSLYSTTGKLGFCGTTCWQQSNTSIPLNQWSFIAVSVNAGALTFYINGTAVGTATNSWTSGQNKSISDDGINNGFEGIIDEPAVYNRSLSAAELLDMWNNGTGISPSSPIVGAPVINTVYVRNSTDGTYYPPGVVIKGYANVVDNSSVNITAKWYVNGSVVSNFSLVSITNNTDVNIGNLSANYSMPGANITLEVKAIGAVGNTTLNASTITIAPFTLTPPIVVITNPVTNGTSQNDWAIINYTVTDNNYTSLTCHPELDAFVYANRSVANNTPSSISLPQGNGNHSLYIYCTNNNSVNNSANASITFNTYIHNATYTSNFSSNTTDFYTVVSQQSGVSVANNSLTVTDADHQSNVFLRFNPHCAWDDNCTLLMYYTIPSNQVEIELMRNDTGYLLQESSGPRKLESLTLVASSPYGANFWVYNMSGKENGWYNPAQFGDSGNLLYKHEYLSNNGSVHIRIYTNGVKHFDIWMPNGSYWPMYDGHIIVWPDVSQGTGASITISNFSLNVVTNYDVVHDFRNYTAHPQGGSGSCGDGVTNTGEQCDTGGYNGACMASCTNSCMISSCTGSYMYDFPSENSGNNYSLGNVPSQADGNVKASGEAFLSLINQKLAWHVATVSSNSPTNVLMLVNTTKVLLENVSVVGGFANFSVPAMNGSGYLFLAYSNGAAYSLMHGSLGATPVITSVGIVTNGFYDFNASNTSDSMIRVFDYFMSYPITRGVMTLVITSPVNGSELGVAEPVNFTATSNYSAILNCTASLDGQPPISGTANNASSTMVSYEQGYGNHTITISCTDGVDNASASVSFTTTCNPSWVCVGYNECVNGSASCAIIDDLNSCNASYGGNFSEFTPADCFEGIDCKYNPVPTVSEEQMFSCSLSNTANLRYECYGLTMNPPDNSVLDVMPRQIVNSNNTLLSGYVADPVGGASQQVMVRFSTKRLKINVSTLYEVKCVSNDTAIAPLVYAVNLTPEVYTYDKTNSFIVEGGNNAGFIIGGVLIALGIIAALGVVLWKR